MKTYIQSFLSVMICSFCLSCSDYTSEPITKDDRIPAVVSDVHYEPLPGGAKISYQLPKDNSLLYIKAVYRLKSGLQREVKSSFYQNHLTIDGLSDVSSYNISLYSVSRSGKESDPVDVEITPSTPPVMLAFKSLQVKETFGGVWVGFENEAEANLVFTILADDSTGVFAPVETFYTKRAAGEFSARGFAPVEKTFGVFVKDRWNNCSDTLYADLTPVFEQMLDKTKFKVINLPGNTHEGHISSAVEKLWDGVTGNAGGNIFHTKPGTGIPQWFNFDMGASTVLSRFKFFHRLAGSSGSGSDGQYNSGDIKAFEVWGSNDPDKDGGWENWSLLGSFTSEKPSGQPIGTCTAEDIQFACVDGEDFEFPIGIPAVRYLRFKITQVWGEVSYIYAAEYTFWGAGM